MKVRIVNVAWFDNRQLHEPGEIVVLRDPAHFSGVCMEEIAKAAGPRGKPGRQKRRSSNPKRAVTPGRRRGRPPCEARPIPALSSDPAPDPDLAVPVPASVQPQVPVTAPALLEVVEVGLAEAAAAIGQTEGGQDVGPS